MGTAVNTRWCKSTLSSTWVEPHENSVSGRREGVLLVTQHVVWPGEVGVSTAGNSHSIFCFAPSYYTFLSIPGQFQFVSNGLSSRSAPEERRSAASWLPPVPARATQPARVTAGCSITINNVLDERMNKYDMENDMENDPITL